MKKNLLIITLLFICTVSSMAQGKFNPEKFKAEIHRYITEEAKLTKEEAAAFFPLFDAMKEKQRTLFSQKKALTKQMPTTDAACRTAIQKHDQLDREMNALESKYHKEMLKVVSPVKVYNALNADRRFMRNTFKKAAKR